MPVRSIQAEDQVFAFSIIDIFLFQTLIVLYGRIFIAF